MSMHSPSRIANEANFTGEMGIGGPAVGQALRVLHQVAKWTSVTCAIEAVQECVPDRAYPGQTFPSDVSLRPDRQRVQPAVSFLDSFRTNPNRAGYKAMDYKQLAWTHSVSWIANEANFREARLGGSWWRRDRKGAAGR